MPKFNPISDKLIVVEDNEEEKTLGGIIIPETSREKPTVGTVLAVGPGSQRETGANPWEMSEIQPGDRIVFQKYGGFHFRLWGKTYLSIRCREILAKLETTSAE